MRVSDYASMAASSLVAAPVRSCLTMLGIVIGVAAITSMAAIGAGARSKVNDQIKSFGSNVIMVNESAGSRAGSDHARRPLSLGDVAAIADPAAVWVIVAVDSQTGAPGAITAWHPVERQGKAGFRPVLLLSARQILRRDPEK